MVIDSPAVLVRQVVTKAEGCKVLGTEEASVIVRASVSEEASVPSSAVSVSMSVVLEETSGAVKVIDMEVALSSCMSRAESCDHR